MQHHIEMIVPMRIAHLSDLHLSPDHFPERTDAFYEILHKCRALKADHIGITGDITNQARPKEFAHARGILKEFGLLDPEKLTVTIGNHDIFGGPYFAEDVLSFPGTCRSTDYESKVKEFHAAFRETFEGSSYFSGPSVFPFVKTVKDVVFAGINSVSRWNSLTNPLGSNGRVEKEQVRRLKEVLSSAAVKQRTLLVLIHHHFRRTEAPASAGTLQKVWNTIESGTMKLWKKKRLVALFREVGAAAVLHGHVHDHEAYERKKVSFLNAGATMLAAGDGQRRFHLLHAGAERVEHADIRMTPYHRSKRTAALA
ncbi:MAG: metallophosphoesterase [Bacteroidetes bacterium]|nr:metallophosphoesterase [Bacteroidota bacterium]